MQLSGDRDDIQRMDAGNTLWE